MAQYKGDMLPEDHPFAKMCQRVVARLGPVTGKEGVEWTVHVIQENVPNAFVIPGGKIFVFTVLQFGSFSNVRAFSHLLPTTMG
jgi:metalloendopeptidase OMA1, mitochondrial